MADDIVHRISFLGGQANHSTSDSSRFDRESLRVMHSNVSDMGSTSVHVLAGRTRSATIPIPNTGISDAFRAFDLDASLVNNEHESLSVSVDRLSHTFSLPESQLIIGRQPVDWGTGRLWQAINVFGSFAPTSLDTEFKPGIDAISYEYFPDNYSSASLTIAANNQKYGKTAVSVVAYYKSLVSDESEFSILFGDVSGEPILGASFESAIDGVGIRIEGTRNRHYTGQTDIHIVAGLDYQFENGLTAILEWRYQDRDSIFNEDVVYRKPNEYLGKHYLGLLLSGDLTPILTGSYLLVYSSSGEGLQKSSLLHQVNLSFSLSDESLFLISFLASVDNLEDFAHKNVSAFENIGQSLSLNYRLYF